MGKREKDSNRKSGWGIRKIMVLGEQPAFYHLDENGKSHLKFQRSKRRALPIPHNKTPIKQNNNDIQVCFSSAWTSNFALLDAKRYSDVKIAPNLNPFQQRPSSDRRNQTSLYLSGMSQVLGQDSTIFNPNSPNQVVSSSTPHSTSECATQNQ